MEMGTPEMGRDTRPIAVWVQSHTRLGGALILLVSGASEYLLYQLVVLLLRWGELSLRSAGALVALSVLLFFLNVLGVAYLLGGRRTWTAMERCPPPLRRVILGAIVGVALLGLLWVWHHLQQLDLHVA